MAALNEKVAIVTGSGRGIGKSIALKLASEGARVVINDIDVEPAEETVAELRRLGLEAVACIGDVTAPEFGERFAATAVKAFGRLDIVVNNAGYTWDTVIQKMSDEQFQAMLDVHAVAPFRILRAAFGPMRDAAVADAKAGREVMRKVVNVSSIVGLTGNPGQVNYAAGKAGLIGITKTLAKEWGRYKINVNAVAFAMIETRMAQPVTGSKPKVKIGDREVEVGVPAELHKAATQFVPLGRWGTPEEAAGAVYLLCSPESNFISGEVLVCGGGMYA